MAYAEYEMLGERFARQSFENPSLIGFQHNRSLSRVGLSANYSGLSRRIVAQKGDGNESIGFDADSYMHIGRSTVVGYASYMTGTDKNVGWSEASDYDLVYPYVTADEIGGDMDTERYYFGGAYSETRGKWAYGGELSYDAGHAYRQVDPRPRNVTGKLDITAGVAYNISGSYYVGIMGAYRKYKQTNELEFKSELGDATVYHLTGLGTVYDRFTGMAYNSYYSGSRYSAGADIYDIRRGWFLSARYREFMFDYILTDFNNLPMSSVDDKEFSFQAGFRKKTQALQVDWVWIRRHGTENIFGDASTGQYPMIASLGMYADNRYSAVISYMYRLKLAGLSMELNPRCGYDHRREVYLYPLRERLNNTVSPRMSVQLTRTTSSGLYWEVTADYGSYLPIEQKSSGGAEGIDLKSHHYKLMLTGAMPLKQRYGLAFKLWYERSCFNQCDGNAAQCSVNFIF